MQIVLTINGVDFTPWLAENGLEYSSVERIRRSVITMDGTDHRSVKEKRQIDVTMYDLPDSELTLAERAIHLAFPAIVSFTDKDDTLRSNIACYVTDPKVTAQKVVGGITYWGSAKFTIEVK